MVQGLIKKKSWMFFYFTARTKHIDAVLAQELKAGASQVVILGSGYDTRALPIPQAVSPRQDSSRWICRP